MKKILKADPIVMVCIPFSSLTMALEFAGIIACAPIAADIHLQVGKINGQAYVIGKMHAKVEA